MMKVSCSEKFTYPTFVAVLLLGVVACGGSGSSSPSVTAASNTYSTTSSKGDYSEWTLTGNSLNASWEVINTTGGVDYTYTIAASCGSADANNMRSCVIDSASCSDGAAACPTSLPSGAFNIMEVPGVALLAQTTASTGGDDLHAGFVKSATACSDDVSGDYTFIRTGVGLQENFGLFRSDANLINILHSDFGFDTTATTASAYTSQAVAYRTSSAAETLADNGCNNGVRLRTTSGGEGVRAMMTASGLYVLDLPAGSGGLLAFKTSKAAALSDFAGKSFGGISFPDNGSPQPFNANAGAVVGGKIDVTVSLSGGTTFNIMELTTDTGLTNPTDADFTVTPTGYNSSPLATSYPTPKDIPGLFKLGNLTDSGRVVMAAMQYNGKLIAIGFVYNYRDSSFSFDNPSTGNPFAGPGLYNSGNFILFEK